MFFQLQGKPLNGSFEATIEVFAVVVVATSNDKGYVGSGRQSF